ncbi:hypothetical protein DVS28_a2564 [Euzebya pacifica]|uniref:Uncharacterized protein n=1 Tax=Euzebya pacifica TaxID=1608957 RepID=A0A346XYE7_9ACTN|nr:hypothetical protein DVS28_a2564 [Euzebya pacifica]
MRRQRHVAGSDRAVVVVGVGGQGTQRGEEHPEDHDDD